MISNFISFLTVIVSFITSARSDGFTVTSFTKDTICDIQSRLAKKCMEKKEIFYRTQTDCVYECLQDGKCVGVSINTGPACFHHFTCTGDFRCGVGVDVPVYLRGSTQVVVTTSTTESDTTRGVTSQTPPVASTALANETTMLTTNDPPTTTAETIHPPTTTAATTHPPTTTAETIHPPTTTAATTVPPTTTAATTHPPTTTAGTIHPPTTTAETTVPPTTTAATTHPPTTTAETTVPPTTTAATTHPATTTAATTVPPTTTAETTHPPTRTAGTTHPRTTTAGTTHPPTTTAGTTHPPTTTAATTTPPTTTPRKVKKCTNNGIWNSTEWRCICSNGWVGDTCERRAKGCKDIADNGYSKWWPPHWIYIELDGFDSPIYVRCQLADTYFTLYMMINQGKVVGHNKSWKSYEDGYTLDDYQYHYWMGLKAMKKLNDLGHTTVYLETTFIYPQKENNILQYRYDDFRFDTASNGYKFDFSHATLSKIGNYSGSVEYHSCLDSLKSVKFSTWDNSDDDGDSKKNCPALSGVGWWYKGCNMVCNPLGLSYKDFPGTPEARTLRMAGLNYMNSEYANTVAATMYFLVNLT